MVNAPPALANVERSLDVANEYRIAYEQLKHVDRKYHETMTLLDNDRRLALQRYLKARAAFHELAELGEEDEYLDEPPEDASA